MTFLAVLVGPIASTPIVSQDAFNDAVEAATEAAQAATERAAAEPSTPLSPGAVETTETADVITLDRSAPATPKDYEVLAPRRADYPPEAWLAGQEGEVGYLLYVGPDGDPQACEITQGSGFDLLDTATCELLMERSEFDPAKDIQGEPVFGEFPGRYRWRKKEPEFGGPMTVHVAFTVGEDGRTTDCETLEMTGNISESMRRQIEREPCPGMNSSDGAPYRDENGVPVAKRVTLLLQVTVEEDEE